MKNQFCVVSTKRFIRCDMFQLCPNFRRYLYVSYYFLKDKKDKENSEEPRYDFDYILEINRDPHNRIYDDIPYYGYKGERYKSIASVNCRRRRSRYQFYLPIELDQKLFLDFVERNPKKTVIKFLQSIAILTFKW